METANIDGLALCICEELKYSFASLILYYNKKDRF